MMVSSWGRAPGWREAKFWRRRVPDLSRARDPSLSQSLSPSLNRGILVWGGLCVCDGQHLGWELDPGGVVGVNLRQRAEKQAADVGENGGTARRDAVLCQEFVEIVEGMVDALCGLEVVEPPGEVEVVIGGLHLVLFGAMLRTEPGLGFRSETLALTPGGRTIGAANRGEDGFRGERFHFETKELRIWRVQKSPEACERKRLSDW